MVTKKKNITDIPWGKKDEKKNRNENENPIIHALLIRQEGVLSLKLSRMRITTKFMNVFNSVTAPHVFSYCCVLLWALTLTLPMD